MRVEEVARAGRERQQDPGLRAVRILERDHDRVAVPGYAAEDGTISMCNRDRHVQHPFA